MERSLFRGTFLEDVLDIIDKKEFIDVAQPVNAYDQLLRDMTSLEKGLATYVAMTGSKIEILVEDIRIMSANRSPISEMNLLAAEVNRLHIDFEMAHTLLWHSVKTIRPVNHSIIMIRSGFKVVRHEFLTCQCPMCQEQIRETIEKAKREQNLSNLNCLNQELPI
jgi:hypothetical protein